MPFDGHKVPPDDVEFFYEPKIVTCNPPPEQRALWKLSRQDCERRYAEAFIANNRPHLRWLAKHDRYFLLTVVLRRPDARRNWLFARCREVEADPDDRLDLWAREHYKAECLQTLTLTSQGWKKHGDLVPGDVIFGPDGLPARVVAKTPVWHDADCYEIEFDDGFRVTVSGDHLWSVERRTRKRIPMAYNMSGPKRQYRETVVLSTQEIAAHDHRQDNRLAVRVNDPLDLPSADLPVDPYVLGLWLGDGGSSTGLIGCADSEVFDLIESAGETLGKVSMDGTMMKRTVLGLQARLKSLEIFGRGKKQIPPQYLRASVAQRLALLQGLMDTDGTCDTRGTATFVNTNDRLVDGFEELCHTLGLKPRRRRHIGKYKGASYPFWQVSFQAYKALPPFRVARKLARCKDGARPKPRRYIVACRRVESVPVSCIQVDRPDGLYLTGRNLVTTHNSTVITFAGIIQEIVKAPDITIGIFAHNRPAAKAFLSQIKRELEDNDLLITLFPEVFYINPKQEAPKWSEDEGIVVRRNSNPKEATVEAWGLVDGMPTGKHFRLRVYDDVVTEKSVTTPDMVAKTTQMFDLSDDLGTHGGRMWMIGTRYHHGDTYGAIKVRGLIKERRYPATDDGTFDGTPVFLSDRDWQRKLSRPRSIVASQQLLNPLYGSETKFDARKLKTWEVRPKTLNVYIMCDPSKGRTSTSDRSAIIVLGIDSNRVKYWLDGWCHRMSLSQRWIQISRLWKRWSNMPGIQATFVGYEQFGMQTDLEYFQERMEVEKLSFPIAELAWPREGPVSKKQRIERLEPDIIMSRFLMPHTFNLVPDGNAVRVETYDPRGTKAVLAAIEQNEKYRTAEPLKKRNEDGILYDPVRVWLEEFMLFPFAPYDDFLDVTSRIYDMEPRPPVSYEDEPGHPNSTEPDVYADGT